VERVAGRRRALAWVIVLALAVAEGKLVFYSLTRRDIEHTVQGLILHERERVAGRQVFMERWTRADRFVLEHIVGGIAREAPTVTRFIGEANRGDFIIRSQAADYLPELVPVKKNRRHRLSRRATDYPDLHPIR
jgi:hypothetical protein